MTHVTEENMMSETTTLEQEPIEIQTIAAEGIPEAPPLEPGLSELEAKHYAAIREQERRVRELESVMFGDAEAHKSSKKRFEAADSELRDLIRRGPDLQQRLPFGDTEVRPDDTWRAWPISELRLTDRQTELLQEAGVEAVGQLEDLRAGAGLTSVAGIGQGNADQIEEAVLNWLSANRDKAALEAARSTEAAPIEPALGDAIDAEAEAWPEAVSAQTIGFLQLQGITKVDELRDWVGAGFKIGQIPGIVEDQAAVLAEFLQLGAEKAVEWDKIPLDDSGFCKRARTALAKNDLTTMGEVMSWIGAGNRFESLEAVGLPTAQKTTAVLQEFCREHGLEDPFASAAEPAMDSGPDPQGTLDDAEEDEAEPIEDEVVDELADLEEEDLEDEADDMNFNDDESQEVPD